MYTTLALLLFSNLLACGDKDEHAHEDTGADTGTDTDTEADIALLGEYEDRYGHHNISNDSWVNSTQWGVSSYTITQYDNEANFAVAENGEDTYNPGLWSKFEWVEHSDALYYCTTTYDSATEEDALNFPASDASDPSVSGCGTSPWSELRTAFDFTAMYGNVSGTTEFTVGAFEITSSSCSDYVSDKASCVGTCSDGTSMDEESCTTAGGTWTATGNSWDTGYYEVSQSNNDEGWAIALNGVGTWADNIGKWSKFEFVNVDGSTYYCQTAYAAETEEEAMALTSDASDVANSGCGATDDSPGFPWSEIIAN